MEVGRRDAVKVLVLAVVLAVGLIGAYAGAMAYFRARVEGQARSMLQSYLRTDGIRFGRFIDYGRGNQCLEFTILRQGKTLRTGAARFGGEHDGSTKPVLRQIVPSFEECKIGAAG